MDSDLPVLAICRGTQVLNVAAGGSLVQDIPSSVTTELSHRIDVPKDCVAHDVSIARGSRLHDALGGAVDAACALPRQQPSPSIGRPARRRARRDCHGTRRRNRRHRVPRGTLLRRRAVAPGEFLADRRVPAAVRRVRGRRARTAGGASRWRGRLTRKNGSCLSPARRPPQFPRAACSGTDRIPSASRCGTRHRATAAHPGPSSADRTRRRRGDRPRA